VPVNERDTFTFGLTFDYTSIDLTDTSPTRYQKYCDNDPSGCDNSTLRADAGWTHDTRDNILFPNRGVLQRLTGEVGLPGLDQEYYKIAYQHTWYKDFTKDLTLMLNGELGYGNSYGSQDYPFFKNFYAGGVSSVRGYETSAIGPRDIDLSTNKDYAVGGTRRAVANAELFFPVPLIKDSKQLRLSAFVDAGTVWGEEGNLADACAGASDCLRYSTGVGVSWYSPFGPIKLVLAKPLNEQDGDKTEVLQFQLGSQF
jgi:outer membrane protein insertion porin family